MNPPEPFMFPDLTAAQQKMLDDAVKEMELGMEDARADGFDPDECFSDIVEASAWEIRDPLVRKEFYRINGCIDRQTGFDPLADV
jgi:hypothetical protein